MYFLMNSETKRVEILHVSGDSQNAQIFSFKNFFHTCLYGKHFA